MVGGAPTPGRYQQVLLNDCTSSVPVTYSFTENRCLGAGEMPLALAASGLKIEGTRGTVSRLNSLMRSRVRRWEGEIRAGKRSWGMSPVSSG